MARSGGIQVEGARTLRRTLIKAGVDVEDLKAAHKKVADMVVARAKPQAPRRTGRLAADTRGAGQKAQAVVRVGRKAVPYAGPIHWGWRKRNIAPNPWLWETAQRTRADQDVIYMDALDAIIRTIEGAPGP